MALAVGLDPAEVWRLYVQNDRSVRATATALGVTRSTVQHHIRPFLTEESEAEPIIPDFPDDDLTAEQIIEYQAKRFQKRNASYAAHTWFPIRFPDNRPIGLLWFGDPHLDDNGCNWPVLKSHVKLCAETPGLYGANIGDTTNNWQGRLIRLYADQDTSLKSARKLAKWFMLESGVRWLIWLLGNHDQWGDGAAILAQMGKLHGTQKVVCHDWEARFCPTFPNGWQPRVFAAHNFKGNSQWNPMHGPMKEGQFGEFADLYVAGHLHHWGIFHWENAAKDHAKQTFVRVRGYKFHDKYARDNGFKQQQSGCAILTIFDPDTREILAFEDVHAGAEYLRMIRSD